MHSSNSNEASVGDNDKHRPTVNYSKCLYFSDDFYLSDFLQFLIAVGTHEPKMPGITRTVTYLLFNWFTWVHAGDAGSVCSGQQPRCPNTAEAGGADGPQSKSHTG